MNEDKRKGWHNVRGVTPAELSRAAMDAERLYGDIIDLPRPVSATHPPMSAENRAAQFSPFAALRGFEDAIDAAAQEAANSETRISLPPSPPLTQARR